MIGYILDRLFPCWTTVKSVVVVAVMQSPIIGREWEEDRVLVVQRSRAGRTRCQMINGAGSIQTVNKDLAMAWLPGVMEGVQ